MNTIFSDLRQRVGRDWRMNPYLSERQRKRRAFCDKDLENTLMQRENSTPIATPSTNNISNQLPWPTIQNHLTSGVLLHQPSALLALIANKGNLITQSRAESSPLISNKSIISADQPNQVSSCNLELPSKFLQLSLASLSSHNASTVLGNTLLANDLLHSSSPSTGLSNGLTTKIDSSSSLQPLLQNQSLLISGENSAFKAVNGRFISSTASPHSPSSPTPTPSPTISSPISSSMEVSHYRTPPNSPEPKAPNPTLPKRSLISFSVESIIGKQ